MTIARLPVVVFSFAIATLALSGCGAGATPDDVTDDGGAADITEDAGMDAVTDSRADSTEEVAADALDAIGDALQDSGGPDIRYWERLPVMSFSGGLYEEVPAVFSRISSYTTSIDGHEPPDPSFLGGSGVGNGLVFAMLGYGSPTNSMHSFAGPGYDLGESFFGDYSLRLASDTSDGPLEFDVERVARSLAAPVMITVGSIGGLELHTVDFAPWFADTVEPGSDSEYLRHCILRNLTVRNTDDQPSFAARVLVRAAGEVSSPQAGVFVEEEPTRMLVTRVADGSGTVDGSTMTIDVGALEPGAEKTFVLTHCAFVPGNIADLPAIDVPALLGKTAAAWQAWEENLVDVTTPDPMVNDFIDGMKLTLKLQTSDGGATCPMSEYTRTWARDNMGPVLGMLALGGFEDVEGYLDYVYYAILKEGDLKNSYPADMTIDWAGVTVPDWASMPVLGDGSVGKKRVSAETPSYMVLMYGLHNRFTGSTERISDRIGLLHRCLFAQGFGDGDMLPFTGDETYRAAMNAAFGLAPEEPHEDINWSGNSSALWLGAAREYARFAAAAGLDDEAGAATSRFAEVEPATIAAYTRPDNCFAAFVAMSDKAQSRPFEDVSLQVTWSGWKDGDDEYAALAFDCLYATARTVDGELCTPLDPQYGGVFRNAWDGTYTGMLPGYTLHSMTVLGHPDAYAAFNMVRRSLDTSGNLQEYMILDDHAGLTLIYQPDGKHEPSDYTAKYRPWEGGIVLDAVMQFLFGFEPDANIRRIDLRPHLPNGWPTMGATGLRAEDDRFDMTVTEKDGVSRVVIRSRADDDWTIGLRWDDIGFNQDDLVFKVDGDEAPLVEVLRSDTNWMPSYMLPDLTVAAGQTLTISVATCACDL